MTQNGNGENEGEKMEESVGVSVGVDDPFQTRPQPPPMAEVPDGLPSDSEFRVLEMSGTNGAVLIVGDRLREVEAAHTRAVEDAQRREDEAARARADAKRMGQVLLAGQGEPDIDETDEGTPQEMALYWRLIPEVDPPKNRCAFQSWQEAATALRTAFPILENRLYTESLRSLGLALIGETRHVGIAQFGETVAMIRALQAHEPQNLLIAQATDGGERMLTVAEQDDLQAKQDEAVLVDMLRGVGERPLGFRESDRFPQPVPQDGAGVSDPPGKSGEWDVDDALGSDPRRDSAPARTDSQPASIRRRLEPAPAAQSVWDEPRREVKEKQEKKTSPRLVYAILALILAMIGLSIAYLYSDSAVMHTEITRQDGRNDSQDEYIEAVDTKVSRVVTALVDEKQNVVVLKRERDEMSSLASSFRDAMQDKAREEGQTRMRYEVRFGQLSEEIARLRRELETEGARRSLAQPEPTPTPSR